MDAGGAGAPHAPEASADAAAVAALCASLSRASLAGGSGTGVVDSAAPAVATVVAALRTHAGDVRVQRSGVAALATLAAGSAANRGAAGSAGAAALVVAAMRAWQQDAELQGSCCAALGNLTRGSAVNRGAAGGAGAVEAVVEALEAHAGAADAPPALLSAACYALSNLVYRSSDNACRAHHAGCTFAVTAALRTHGGAHAEVARAGCFALATLRAAFFDAGAAEAVAAAMRAYAPDVGLQAVGCSALRNLLAPASSEPPLVLRALAPSLVPTLVAALHAHAGGSVELCRNACEVLCIVAQGSQEGEGASAAVAAAMRAHATDAVLQAHGCAALDVLCDGVADSTAACSAAVDTVVAALTAHRSNAEVQLLGCVALHAMIVSTRQALGDAAKQAVTAGGIEAATATLRAHADSALVRRAGCMVLAVLAACNEAHAQRACAAGAMGAVVDTLCAFALPSARDCEVGDSDALPPGARANARTAPAEAACCALDVLTRGSAARQAEAVRAGGTVLTDSFEDRATKAGRGVRPLVLPTQCSALRAQLGATLRAAAVRHDVGDRSGGCTHAACSRCAALRECDTFVDAHEGLAALRARAGDTDALARCMQELSDMADEPENACPFLEVGECLVAEVVAIMRTHAGHAELQHQACRLLGALCADDSASCRIAAGAAGAVELVLGTLRATPVDNVRALSSACLAVCNMIGECLPNVERAITAGAVASLVGTLKAHAEPPYLVAVASSALGHIVCAVDATAGAMRAAGVADALLPAMRVHLHDDATLQRVATLLLGRLAPQEEGDASALRDSVAWSVDIVAAMCAHPGDIDLQRNGCGSLARIQFDTEGAQCAAAAAAALVAAMRAHPADVEMHQDACYALMRHSGSAATAVVLAVGNTAGVVRALVAALRAHPGDERVQARAFGALEHLCIDDGGRGLMSVRCIEEARAAGALDLVLAAMRTHTASVCVQQEACSLLSALLSRSPAMQSQAGALGAVAAALAVTQLHAADATIQARCCAALAAMCMSHVENTARACAADGIEVIVASLRSTLSGAATQSRLSCGYALFAGCRLLTELLQGHADREARALRAGALEAVAARPSPQGRRAWLEPDVLGEAEASSTTVMAAIRAAERLLPLLRAAAQRHDAGACAAPADCARCAASRATGALCGLPACCARTRDGGAKKLKKCSGCRVVAYCGPEHQHEDWARHKGECRAAAKTAAAEAER
jgi:hypothetical protein